VSTKGVTSFFRDKKTWRNHKTVVINVFLYYFCLLIEGPDPDPYLWLMDPDADPGGQNIWILRVRICETGCKESATLLYCVLSKRYNDSTKQLQPIGLKWAAANGEHAWFLGVGSSPDWHGEVSSLGGLKVVIHEPRWIIVIYRCLLRFKICVNKV
jgi:hypothetical protein